MAVWIQAAFPQGFNVSFQTWCRHFYGGWNDSKYVVDAPLESIVSWVVFLNENSYTEKCFIMVDLGSFLYSCLGNGVIMADWQIVFQKWVLPK